MINKIEVFDTETNTIDKVNLVAITNNFIITSDSKGNETCFDRQTGNLVSSRSPDTKYGYHRIKIIINRARTAPYYNSKLILSNRFKKTPRQISKEITATNLAPF